MNTFLPELIFLFVLTLVHAFFAGGEEAFRSLREPHLGRLEERSTRGQRVATLARNPQQMFSSIQVLLTLANFLAAATAALWLSTPFADLIEPVAGRASMAVSVALLTAITALFTLIIGRFTPRALAGHHPEAWALITVGPLRGLAQLFRPIVWLTDRCTNGLVRLAGVDPSAQREDVTEEEIRDMLQTQESFSPDQRSIIEGAFEIGERTLREIVVPRGSVLSISQSDTISEALQALATAGHSRAPVHKGDLDEVLGIVHVRDLISHQEGQVSDQTRPATVVPESLGVLDALRRLQSARQQMAIVVNEHGGVEGIITVEDLLEEIVGEIYDEFDRDVAEIQRGEDGSIVLPGSFPIHDLPDVDVEVPEHVGNYATIAGYVLEQLGHIPTPGETAVGPDWNVEVLSVEERAITKVRLIPAEEGPAEETPG